MVAPAFVEPRSIPLSGDPDGLVYDPRADALYVGDAASGEIVRITDDGQERVAALAPGAPIAGLAVARDGTLFATRGGAVLRVTADGAIAALPQLAPRRGRRGLALAPDARHLYAPSAGGVIEIALEDRYATTVFDGFVDPVGIAAVGGRVVVGDAGRRAIYAIELVAGRAVAGRELASALGRPDAMCAWGDDAVLVSSYDDRHAWGAVHVVDLAGRVHQLASGPWEPRGIATDGRLVYVAARGAGRLLVFAAR